MNGNAGGADIRLLDRLDRVRETGPGQWIARCPGHDDKSPSLSVRELADGIVLIHCFAGCDSSDILAAVGLELRDLFPRPSSHHRRPEHISQRWDYRALLRLLRGECGIVLIAANDLRKGRQLADVDHARLREAIQRVSNVVAVAE